MQTLYYNRDGHTFGPVSAPQLKQLAATGKLQPKDLVRKDSMNEWVCAGNIRGLFAAPQTTGIAGAATDGSSREVLPSTTVNSEGSGRGTKIAFGVAGVALTSLLGFALWALVLRDTWELDNYAKISELCRSTRALVTEGKLEEAH